MYMVSKKQKTIILKNLIIEVIKKCCKSEKLISFKIKCNFIFASIR